MANYWTDIDCVHIADDIDDCSWQKDTKKTSSVVKTSKYFSAWLTTQNLLKKLLLESQDQ